MLFQRIAFLLFCIIDIFLLNLGLEHPLVKPDYYDELQLFSLLVITWSSLTSARWLLRESSLASHPGPRNDYTKLWLWTSPFIILLTVVSLIIYSITDGQTHWTRLFTVWFFGHSLSTLALYSLTGGLAVFDLFRDNFCNNKERFTGLAYWVAQLSLLAIVIFYVPGKLVALATAYETFKSPSLLLFGIAWAVQALSLCLYWWQPKPSIEVDWTQLNPNEPLDNEEL